MIRITPGDDSGPTKHYRSPTVRKMVARLMTARTFFGQNYLLQKMFFMEMEMLKNALNVVKRSHFATSVYFQDT